MCLCFSVILLPHYPIIPVLRFSIITVTYNAAESLAATIASVEAQRHPAIEHLIIDGNSSDDTLALVHHYQERNSHRSQPCDIVCRSEDDRGIYDAMNKGLDLATGDYLVFLNAGDTLAAPTTLSDIAEQVAQATAGSSQPSSWPAVLYGDTDIVDADGTYLRPRHHRPPETLAWRTYRRGMLVCHQAFYVRTDLARAQHYDLRFRLSADYDWCIRVMQQAEADGLDYLNTHLVLCHYLDGGVSVQRHRASLIERYRIMRRHFGLLPTLWSHCRKVVASGVARLKA